MCLACFIIFAKLIICIAIGIWALFKSHWAFWAAVIFVLVAYILHHLGMTVPDGQACRLAICLP
jgi:TctA family transporter